MKEIILTQGKVALVDDEDFEELSKYKWCAARSSYTYYALRAVTVNNTKTTIAMHQVIMKPDAGLDVDHKDGNKLNNQKFNLRVCSHKANTRNQQKRFGTSSYKGVSWDKVNCKWFTTIKVNGKGINLGRYSTEEEAATVYNAAAIKYFGEYAKLNVLTKD
jgi:hypothetical protein